MNKRILVSLFFLIVVTIGIFILYFFLQPHLTYSRCELCDGNQYAKIFEYFNGKQSTYTVPFPYYSRVFVPVLAFFVSSNNLVWGFQLVNLLFSLAGVVSLFFLWYKLDVPFYLMGIGFFWLLFHWTGIIRLNAFDPITVDLPTYVFQTLIVLIVLYKRFIWLCVLGPIAVFQRESIIVLLLVVLLFVLINHSLNSEQRIPLVSIVAALVITIAAKYLFTFFYPSIDTDKNSLRLVLFYIKEVIIDPFKLVRWLIAILTAYGILFALVLKELKLKYFSSYIFNFLALLSLTYIFLAIIAGGDSTRIVFLGFPFVMTWMLLVLKDLNWKLVLMAFLLSILPMRLFETIPDPGIDFRAFASWYPEFSGVGVVLMWGLYFLISYVILWLFGRFYKL